MTSKPILPERRPVATAPERPVKPLEDESPLVADERAYEALESQERQDGFLEQGEDVSSTTATSSLPVADEASVSSTSTLTKHEVTVQLEKILEEGLGDYVASMPEEARTRFLYKGQETADRLSVMVRGVKIQAKKVVELIRDWLLTIPGVNKFFLEQEAKIKTDRVLSFNEEYQDKKKNTL